MRSRWVHESSTRASSLQNFALRSPSSFYLLMILFLHRLSSSPSLRKKKGKPQRPFQKVKEYRARIRSIPRPRNKLDDAPFRLTSRYVNTYRCNISYRLGCRNRSAIYERETIFYISHTYLSSCFMDLLNSFYLTICIYVNVRDENFIIQNCRNIRNIAVSTRGAFVAHYLTYLKLIFP